MYMDPCLESGPLVYADFLNSLHQASVLRWDLVARSVVGCFCFRKKVARSLRLVIDCRRSNVLFRRPSWTPLGSLEALCHVWSEGTARHSSPRRTFETTSIDCASMSGYQCSLACRPSGSVLSCSALWILPPSCSTAIRTLSSTRASLSCPWASVGHFTLRRRSIVDSRFAVFPACPRVPSLWNVGLLPCSLATQTRRS